MLITKDTLRFLPNDIYNTHTSTSQSQQVDMTKRFFPSLEISLQALGLWLISAYDLLGDDEFFGLFVLDDAASTEELVLEDGYEGELLEEQGQLGLFAAA